MQLSDPENLIFPPAYFIEICVVCFDLRRGMIFDGG